MRSGVAQGAVQQHSAIGWRDAHTKYEIEQCDSELDFGKRLIEDLKTIAPTNTRLRVYAPPERARSAWIGGCVLTSLSPFGYMWITKEEWETEGSVIVHKKSLMLSVSSKQSLKDSEHLGVFGEVFGAPLALQ